jgi:ribose 5-phosphate isomerase B
MEQPELRSIVEKALKKILAEEEKGSTGSMGAPKTASAQNPASGQNPGLNSADGPRKSAIGPGRALVNQKDVLEARAAGVLVIPKDAIITPLARDTAERYRVQFRFEETAVPSPGDGTSSLVRRRVAIGSDHGGFELKEVMVQFLREEGFETKDFGTFSKQAVDYPDFAAKVAASVAKGDCSRGIIIDGVGVGSCMTANKIPGIRAANCYDAFSARNSREHNDANVLCLGGRVTGPELAKSIVRTWLTTDFAGGRHARRVQKIVAIERSFLRSDTPDGIAR